MSIVERARWERESCVERNELRRRRRIRQRREEKKQTDRHTTTILTASEYSLEKKRMNDEMALGRNEQSKTQSTRFDVSYLRYPREIDKNAHINEKKRNNYEYTQ